jgi:sulfide:quinone oxidoreductase
MVRQGIGVLTMGRTVIVLGAGLGGLVVAEKLRKLLPDSDRVIAVDRTDKHFFPPSLLWLMVGDRKPEDFTRSFDRLANRGVELRRGNVTRIDAVRKEVEIDGQSLAADALVIALGADYAPEAIPGLAAAGLNIYTLEGAGAIHDALARFGGGRIVILTAAPMYKCPAAPYEAALLVDAFLRKHGLRDKTTIEFFAAEPRPMFVAGPEVGAAVRGMVEAQGVAYHPEHQVKEIDPAARRVTFANGTTAEYDLLFYVPPHRAPAVVREAGLTNEAGWIPVDRHTLQTQFEGVFAIGDITPILLKMGRPLPKAGIFAHGQAEVVANNIAYAWTSRGSPRKFVGEGMCFIETGNARAGIGKGNFYAEPMPQVEMRGPNLFWHIAKILYEKYWLYRHF